MNIRDPDNLLCGITIDVTPFYRGEDAKQRCQKLLWKGDEASPRFRRILERGARDSMARVIGRQFKNCSLLHFRAEATGDKWTEDDGEHESISIEIDVFGHSFFYDAVAPIVADIATGAAVCDDVRTLLAEFTADHIPTAAVIWKIEPTEYAE